MQRSEILDFVKRDHPNYSWSLRTLDRRLRFFNTYYIDKAISLQEVRLIVQNELQGPGQLLGYRALHLKVRQKYEINLSRDMVYDMMTELDPDGLSNRQPGLKKKKQKDHFVSKGSNWVLSVERHDKFMGYQNSTFPIAIYGFIDTASRKILWLRCWTSNSKPEIIERWYLEYLYESKKLPCYLRMDKGTETGVMATMQCFLRQHHNDIDDPVDSVIYGPSTSNQVCMILSGWDG